LVGFIHQCQVLSLKGWRKMCTAHTHPAQQTQHATPHTTRNTTHMR
jgi:hypothetical protein